MIFVYKLFHISGASFTFLPPKRFNEIRMLLTYLIVVGGLGLLVVGAESLGRGSSALALRAGVTPLLIGLTVVAIGTSLPELATSVIAAFKGEGDIAVGNAIGSSIFNIFCILGVATLIAPIQSGEISTVELGVMMGMTLLTFLLIKRDFRLNRWEGALLVLGYCGYLYHLVPRDTC